MEKIILQAEPRGGGRHAIRLLRDSAKVPAVVYGHGGANQLVAVDAKQLHRALVAAGAGLISLQVGPEPPVQVLAREVQRHPVKHNTLHVDFMSVSMTERLRLEMPIVLEGTAPALSLSGMVMVRHRDSVEIECLPSDIPNHIAGDLSKLVSQHDCIYVRDLLVPPGVDILEDPAQVVVSLTMSAGEVAEEEASSAPSADQVEVVTRGKKEEEA